MRPLLLSVALLHLAACSIETATGCDFRDQDTGSARCQEREGTQAGGYDAICEGLGDTVVEGGCDLTGAVAGCTVSAPGGAITDWYYPPETVETVTVLCEEEDAELVMP